MPLDSKPIVTPPTTLTQKRSPKDISSDATPSPKKVKTTPSKVGKGDAWTPEMRLKLFEAYQTVANVHCETVAETMGEGMTGKQCREQWQRATGAKIRKALGEK